MKFYQGRSSLLKLEFERRASHYSPIFRGSLMITKSEFKSIFLISQSFIVSHFKKWIENLIQP